MENSDMRYEKCMQYAVDGRRYLSERVNEQTS